MSTAPDQEQALRLKTYLTLALAEINGLDIYSAFLAVLLLRDGISADEAVRLAVEGYDQRVTFASAQAKELLAQVRAELAEVSA